jgi:hypothetical protein
MKKYLVAAVLIASFGFPGPVKALSSLQWDAEAKSQIIHVGQSAADRCCLACNSTFSGCVKSREAKGQPTSSCQLEYNKCYYACPDYKSCKNYH